MSQQPGSAPPPYAQEYTKPPAYFNPGTNSAAPDGNPPYPTTHAAQGGEPGWYPAPPPPPYHPQTEMDQRQQAGNPNRGGPTVISVTTGPAYPQQQTVLVLGNCPSCRVGFLRDEFSICGILLAFIFFPIGILCCLCMMDKRCSHCGARF